MTSSLLLGWFSIVVIHLLWTADGHYGDNDEFFEYTRTFVVVYFVTIANNNNNNHNYNCYYYSGGGDILKLGHP